MKIEHFALNVPDPVGLAAWYCENLGMTIVVKTDKPPFMHFLSDDSGDTLIEVYTVSEKEMPNYHKYNPLQFHLAFVSDDPDTDKNRLLKAGASFANNLHVSDGSYLVMMRDPWGIAFQLCKRRKPMLAMQKK